VSFTPRLLCPRERTLGAHWIGGCVDPRIGLDDVEKRKFLTLSELKFRPLGRPVRSQSLYGLRYPGVLQTNIILIISTCFIILRIIHSSSDSSVGIATGRGLDGRSVGIRVLIGARFFYSPLRPDLLWRPLGAFPGIKAAGA
jgi:hypothetical protein